MTAVNGWLFDAYAVGPRMVFWIKTAEGKAVRITDDWAHCIYVGSDNIQDLQRLAESDIVKELVSHDLIVRKKERITDKDKSDVLRLTLKDSTKAVALAKRIETIGRFGQYRLYNVDVLPAQAYFYEHELYPLAFCEFDSNHGWTLKEEASDGRSGVWLTDYAIPEFRTVHLSGIIHKSGRLPKFSDEIERLDLKVGSASGQGGGAEGKGGETITIERQDSEAEVIHELTRTIRELDPDIVFTEDGDAFFLPYLAHRAAETNAALILGRDPEALMKPKKEGTSYFSYGKINFKPTAVKLKGRLHLDVNTSFAYSVAGLHGLYEVSRICRLPLQHASRASIGKCLSSLQFYNAFKQDLLVPWKPVLAEHFKTREELLVADRGGLIFEPEIGTHEQVAELDFVSLYPSIMHQKNISAETVKCGCCLDSASRVPELGYNICQKKKGLVPLSLDIVLRKRREYKQLRNSSQGEEREIYDARQNALKWILVTSFGYLGFSNAKFGRIDAHIAVCAFDRQILLQAADTAETLGFRVLHGIVDSLYVRMEGAQKQHYVALKSEIEKRTGFEISFEGVYRWLVFLPSNMTPGIPVPNRYFGAFEDGTLKVRGIEARRHDTPALFARCQMEMLQLMATAKNVAEVKSMLDDVKEIYWRYVKELRSGKVVAEDLIFWRVSSKDQYEDRRTVEGDARRLLEQEGKKTKAGEAIGFIITDQKAKHGPKTLPIQMIEVSSGVPYDAGRYVELLTRVASTVLLPFGQSVGEERRQSKLV